MKYLRAVALGTVLVPAAGTAFALAYWALGHPVGWVEVTLFAALYLPTSLAVEAGMHRHFAHRSFDTKPFMRVLFAVFGSMAGQGSVLFWVATHRHHHKWSDKPKDVHSPHVPGSLPARLWHAHVGWMTSHYYWDDLKLIPDVMNDTAVCAVAYRYFTWVVLGVALPAVAGGLWHGSLEGALQGALWGGFVRIFVLQHFTWAVNSIGHVFGKRPYDSRDMSTNILWMSFPTAGMSLHNTHHAFPNSATNQLRWWELDPSAWFIRLLAAVGLATNVRVPSAARIASRTRS